MLNNGMVNLWTDAQVIAVSLNFPWPLTLLLVYTAIADKDQPAFLSTLFA